MLRVRERVTYRDAMHLKKIYSILLRDMGVRKERWGGEVERGKFEDSLRERDFNKCSEERWAVSKLIVRT